MTLPRWVICDSPANHRRSVDDCLSISTSTRALVGDCPTSACQEARSVAVESVAAGIEGELEVCLGGVDGSGRGGGVEHPENREPETCRVQVAELDVAAVTVGCVGGPALQDVLSSVGLPNVVPTVAGVGDEVDPDDRGESGAPGGVPVLTDNGLQLG